MRIVSLSSGSSGNVFYIKAGETRLLVDCGLTCKQIEERLACIGERLENINYIVISHEHNDHIGGLEVVYKKYHIPIYANYLSAEVIERHSSWLEGNINTFDNEVMKLGDLTVTPIPVSHDSVSCNAFKIEYKEDVVSIVTDLGYIDDGIIDKIKTSKVVYIESNHDETMLANCKYPYIIKKRIRSDRGHLSNTQAGNAIVQLFNYGVKFFVLSHISANSNTYEKAYFTISRILSSYGISVDTDLTIRFAHQGKVGNNFILGEDKNG